MALSFTGKLKQNHENPLSPIIIILLGKHNGSIVYGKWKQNHEKPSKKEPYNIVR
jgi:hypothetical protein